MQQNFIEELRWRGLIYDIMPGAEEQLKSMTVGYIGFDPTAKSLHIGNLATVMMLIHFQKAGHKPCAVIGGATGMVGDPSGKSEERSFLDENVLRQNQAGIKNQLEKFLDFECVTNAAFIVNNYDWHKEFGFLQFLRDVGKHISVSYMMAKDSVKNRLESGISFTEFSYQLLQGYDFYYLYTHHNVKMQMGGSDQWGNMVTGTELIRKKANGNAFVITAPLITKPDGTKFGKSEKGNIWLDPTLTSPYRFYQFWINCSDEESPKLIRIFTLFSKAEIEDLEVQHLQNPHLRILQKAIAKEVTIRVHSQYHYEQALKASQILFEKESRETVLHTIEDIEESLFLEIFDGVEMVVISFEQYKNFETLGDLLSVDTQFRIFPSKGEAKKSIQNGGVSINKIRYSDPYQKPTVELLKNKYILVQKGKKNYVLIQVER
ncbi:MAG: tyrosine--tRNA ligase [Chitinophagaceae bacterium]|nr:tyrosine--tRNA ligase [Chitinophagaceae bacterium]